MRIETYAPCPNCTLLSQQLAEAQRQLDAEKNHNAFEFGMNQRKVDENAALRAALARKTAALEKIASSETQGAYFGTVDFLRNIARQALTGEEKP